MSRYKYLTFTLTSQGGHILYLEKRYKRKENNKTTFHKILKQFKLFRNISIRLFKAL